MRNLISSRQENKYRAAKTVSREAGLNKRIAR
jgi:hypothetical protein